MARKAQPPLHLIALDLIGTALIGLGLAEAIVKTELVPQAFRFTNYEWMLVAAGVVMMIPMMLWALQKISKHDSVH